MRTKTIWLSGFLRDKELSLTYDRYRIVWDLEKREFLRFLSFFYYQLLYPLYWHRKKIILVDFPFSDLSFSISPELLHTNMEAVQLQLLLEAWFSLCRCTRPLLLDVSIDDDLNAHQKEAIREVEGMTFVLAPAGSGKTKTLISRIKHMVEQGIPSHEILVLMFNRKACEEVKERLQKVFSDQDFSVYTFHSFGYHLLERYSGYQFTEDADEMNLVLLEEAYMKHYPLVYDQKEDILENALAMLSKVKRDLLDESQMQVETLTKTIPFYPIFQDYLQAFLKEQYYGYDDMLYLVLYLLLTNAHLRQSLQQKYPYLLIDEVQDLNRSQWLLVELLFYPRQNLFVVGDDDQQIYDFRGATLKPFYRLYQANPFSQKYILTENYRSCYEIVKHANYFISKNFHREEKEMIAMNQGKGDIAVFLGKSYIDEAKYLLRWALLQPRSFSLLILTRHRKFLFFIQTFFALQGVSSLSFSMVDEIPKFWSLLQFFFDQSDTCLEEVAFLFLHTDTKFATREALLQAIETQNNPLFHRIRKLFSLFKTQDLSLSLFLFYLQISFPDEKNQEMWLALISMFSGVFAFYQTVCSPHDSVERDIHFSTIHRVKGNEFDAVGYFHMEDVKEKEMIEQERKISYVAFTRAKICLCLTASRVAIPIFLQEYLFQKEKPTYEDTITQYYRLEEKLFRLEKEQKLLAKDIVLLNQKNEGYEVQEEVVSYTKTREEIYDNREIQRQKLFQEKERLLDDLYYLSYFS